MPVKKVKFPHLSLGYIGISNENETLNSRFFSCFFSEKFDLRKKIYFPQRIPKKAFFNEMERLENHDWLAFFHEKQNMLLQNIHEQIDGPVNAVIFNNSINCALRLGLCEKLKPMLSKLNVVALQCDIESELLVQVVALQYALENECDFDEKPLENLLWKVLINTELKAISKVMVFTYGVVFYSRFKVSFSKILLEQIRIRLEIELELLPKNFIDCLYASVALRGLPMLSLVSIEKKKNMLGRAEQLARDMFSEKQDWQILLAKENLYTLLQTKAKWFFHQGNSALAEPCFEEMVELDSYDATVYSEYGFFLL